MFFIYIILSSITSSSIYISMECIFISIVCFFKYLFGNWPKVTLVLTNQLPFSNLFRTAQSLPYSFSHSASPGSDHPSFLSALHPAFGSSSGHPSAHALPYYQVRTCSIQIGWYPFTASISIRWSIRTIRNASRWSNFIGKVHSCDVGVATL